MTKKLLYLFTILFSFYLNAQVQPTGVWSAVGDSNLIEVSDDNDNGDNAGDGAVKLKGLSTATAAAPIGLRVILNGTMTNGEVLNVTTCIYNESSSFVKLYVALYNATKDPNYQNPLVRTPSNTTVYTLKDGNRTEIATLNYTATANDAGDKLEIRYMRDDGGHIARTFSVDWLKLNNNTIPDPYSTGGGTGGGTGTIGNNYPNCTPTTAPDLPITASNSSVMTEINTIVDRMSAEFVYGSGNYNNAISNYNGLGISINSNKDISATLDISVLPSNNVYPKMKALVDFAKIIKSSPTSTQGKDAIEKSQNILWLLAKQSCNDVIKSHPPKPYKHGFDETGYAMSPPLTAAFLVTAKHIDADLKPALLAFVEKDYEKTFKHFWGGSYASYNNDTYQNSYGVITTDRMANHLSYLVGAVNLYSTDNEKLRHMRAVTRYIERFLTILSSKVDGIKLDGSGFHHSVAYHNYLNCYKTIIRVLYTFRGTSFQINKQKYENFRKGVYAQLLQANDGGILALSNAGRKPQNRWVEAKKSYFERLAVLGGEILGLSTPDPILAGMAIQRYNSSPSNLNGYSTTRPSDEGFIQMNQSCAGFFRKNNWIAYNKGFTSGLAGNEIYTNQNRYGRYQNHGALEILYPGNSHSEIGYNSASWDWRYNPGATTIIVPWNRLYAGGARADEYQEKDFVGSLAFNNKNNPILPDTYGTYGMFSMDFDGKPGASINWSTPKTTDTHDDNFTFKKTNFYFDDMIVCLGSNIKSSDATGSTVTTLYQRLDNKSKAPIVNGATQSSSGTYSKTSTNWLISNYDTGFYLMNSNSYNGTLTVKKETQQNPDQGVVVQNLSNGQVVPTINYSNTTSDRYYSAYIDHGVTPNNDSYEYIIKPGTTSSKMTTLDNNIKNNNKPYTVYAQNTNKHIIKETANNIWGYSFFTAQTGINYQGSTVKGANQPSMIMGQLINPTTYKMSISDPIRQYRVKVDKNPTPKDISVTLYGKWALSTPTAGVLITSPANATETVIQFTLYDGLPKEITLIDPTNMSNDRVELENVSIYPNPAKDNITITNNGNNEITAYSITNMLGKTVSEKQPLLTNDIDVSNLKNGVYLLKMITENNEYGTKKIVIQK